MTLAEMLLAISLLTGSAPPDLQDPAFLRATYPILRFPLMQTAMAYEVLDPRETRYVLARAKDFPGDLRILQRRYQELADAPALRDASRFPDRTVINELLVSNRLYRNDVETRQPMEKLREVDYLHEIWDTVRDARCEYYYVTIRRQALKKLREMLGDEAYYQSTLPPHIPLALPGIGAK